MDPRTLWLARPDDRYQPSPALRNAERAVYPLIRAKAFGPIRRQEAIGETLTANG